MSMRTLSRIMRKKRKARGTQPPILMTIQATCSPQVNKAAATRTRRMQQQRVGEEGACLCRQMRMIELKKYLVVCFVDSVR